MRSAQCGAYLVATSPRVLYGSEIGDVYHAKERMSRRSGSGSGSGSGSNSSRAVAVCDALDQRVPKRVVEEEEFVSNLERLIRRDYFPSMLSEEDKLLVPKVSLSEYLANHTSEDSASFEEIVQTMKEQQRKAFYWIDAEAETKRKAELRAQQGQLILSKEYRDDDRPKCIDTSKYVTRNQVSISPWLIDANELLSIHF